jgi:hypothetical protein
MGAGAELQRSMIVWHRARHMLMGLARAGWGRTRETYLEKWGYGQVDVFLFQWRHNSGLHQNDAHNLAYLYHSTKPYKENTMINWKPLTSDNCCKTYNYKPDEGVATLGPYTLIWHLLTSSKTAASPSRPTRSREHKPIPQTSGMQHCTHSII